MKIACKSIYWPENTFHVDANVRESLDRERILSWHKANMSVIFARKRWCFCWSVFDRGAPLLSKFRNLSFREILVATSAYAHPYRLWGRGRRVPRQPDGGWRMPSFLGRKSRGAFVQPAFFFLAGNRMTTATFEKEVF